jgi:hypothetical protein
MRFRDYPEGLEIEEEHSEVLKLGGALKNARENMNNELRKVKERKYLDKARRIYENGLDILEDNKRYAREEFRKTNNDGLKEKLKDIKDMEDKLNVEMLELRKKP